MAVLEVPKVFMSATLIAGASETVGIVSDEYWVIQNFFCAYFSAGDVVGGNIALNGHVIQSATIAPPAFGTSLEGAFTNIYVFPGDLISAAELSGNSDSVFTCTLTGLRRGLP